jgi:membrane protein YqaA with SNARE-associated domain
VLHRLYQSTMRLAASPYAPWWLAGMAFVEASVFPIPPDLLLIPMVIAARHRAWRYALITALASVAGGCLGYAIGALLFDQFGRGIIAFYHLQSEFEAFKAAFDRWGGWLVLGQGMTPIPYKLVTIASGVAGLDPGTFLAAALVSRSVRFFLVAALFWRFGEPIRDFVEKRLVLVTSAFLALLVGGYFLIKLA